MSRPAHFEAGLGNIHRVREEFASRNGITAAPDFKGTYIHPDTTRRIASAYADLPVHDPDAVGHWEHMRHGLQQQYDRMTEPESKGGLGLSVHVQDENPYDTPSEMFHDVLNNKRIHVLSTKVTGGHPVFGNDGNDMFRAVHDVFGHVGSGRGFDRHGEEAAYLSHARMFGRSAHPALVSETRGQNSYFNTYGEFPDQKIATLPARFNRPVALSAGNQAGRRAARAQANLFNRQQFSPVGGA